MSVASRLLGAMPKSSGGKSTGVEEAAAARVGPVGRLGVGVEVVLGPPVGRRDLGDRVEPVADVGPVARQVVGLGEQAAHSDDRHRDGLRGIGRVQVSSLSSVDDSGRVATRQESAGRARIRGTSLHAKELRPLLDLTAIQGRKSRASRGERDPLAGEHPGPGEHRRAVEDVQRDRGHPAILGRLEERPADPLVERRHRRAAPDLVVDRPRRLARVRPVRRLAEVPAEDQRHLVLGVALGPLDLRRVALAEVVARLLPDLRQRGPEERLLERRPDRPPGSASRPSWAR